MFDITSCACFTTGSKKVVWDTGHQSKLPCPEGDAVMIESLGNLKYNNLELMIVKVTFLTGTVLTHQPNGVELYVVESNPNNLSKTEIDKLLSENSWIKNHLKYNYVAYAQIETVKISFISFLKMKFKNSLSQKG